jgi:hypothetical protein
VSDARLVTVVRRGGESPARVQEGGRYTDADVAAALAHGVLPVDTMSTDGPAAAWIMEPEAALAAHAAGMAPWRITVRHTTNREETLDALARTGAPFLRTTLAELSTAVDICSLPGSTGVASVAVDSHAEALTAVRVGAGDLVLGSVDDDALAALRTALAPMALVERTAFPIGLDVDLAREALARPLLKAYLDQVDGSGAVRPRHLWAPGRDLEPPVPPRRLSAQWSDDRWTGAAPMSGIDHLTPQLAAILDRSLDGTPPTRDEVERLFRARGEEVEAIAWVADILRERTCGDTVTYVINRNINYTNVCYFRCGFCGFSKGPKSLNLRGEPYMVPIEEVVARSVEASELGATEVCLQGGIHPDFTGDFYLQVLSAIKDRLPRGLAGCNHAGRLREGAAYPPA